MATDAPKTRLKGSQRRELIVDAALPEFAQRGYEAASVGRIARAAGVARTVLYDHFPSKHALFVKVLDAQEQTLLAYLRAALVSEGTTEERWRSIRWAGGCCSPITRPSTPTRPMSTGGSGESPTWCSRICSRPTRIARVWSRTLSVRERCSRSTATD
jgi:AcrR family transcriptional regulator